ncbi:IS3 family transposase [Xylophilus sp. ASV27]
MPLDHRATLEASEHDYAHYYNHERIKLGLKASHYTHLP